MDRKKHWENIFETKTPEQVSWHEPIPEFSLELFNRLADKRMSILNVGGGDSPLVDHLLERGYINITTLDISSSAIERMKRRIGENACCQYIVTDITDFNPSQTYDLWFDRAAFHFLTSEEDIEKYVNALQKGLEKTGTAIIGTFSKNGPLKCSGIEISQYDQEDFERVFGNDFKIVEVINMDHTTPFDTVQNFNFAVLQHR